MSGLTATEVPLKSLKETFPSPALQIVITGRFMNCPVNTMFSVTVNVYTDSVLIGVSESPTNHPTKSQSLSGVATTVTSVPGKTGL